MPTIMSMVCYKKEYVGVYSSKKMPVREYNKDQERFSKIVLQKRIALYFTRRKPGIAQTADGTTPGWLR
jgi:hypothetical protein